MTKKPNNYAPMKLCEALRHKPSLIKAMMRVKELQRQAMQARKKP